MKDLQAELMAKMAETVPFEQMVRQVQAAITEYRDNPTEKSEGYLIFVMQITLMSYLIKRGGTTADNMIKDLEKQEKVMNLFKENNN